MSKKTLSDEAQTLCKDLQDLAEKLQRVPEKHEYLTKGKFKEWQIRKYFGGWEKLLSKSGVLSLIDPDVQTFSDLRLKNTKLIQELKEMKSQLGEMEKEAVSAKSLKSIIHGVTKEQGIDRKQIEWMTSPKQDVEGIPVLFITDIHFDEVVHPEQIQGLNKYNREIAIKRIQHTFNSAIRMLTEQFVNPKYEGLVLAFGGDNVSGNIHEELAETNEAAMNQTILILTDVLIECIDRLLAKFTKIFVPAVVGNHGRLHKKPRHKNQVFDNFEWLVYQFLKRHYKDNPNIVFMVPDGPDAQFQVYNKSILLTHGSQFHGGSGIAGIYSPIMLGLSRKQKRNASVKRPFDLMLIGHFHQLLMSDAFILGGSIKGYDEFAFDNNFSFEPPKQALFIIHPQRGIIHQMPIFCDGYEDKAAASSILKIW